MWSGLLRSWSTTSRKGPITPEAARRVYGFEGAFAVAAA